MNAVWAVLAGVAAAGAAAAGAREARWRSRAARELSGEVALGTIHPEDLEALVSWQRFGRKWLASAPERRAFRRIARSLALANESRTKASPARRKLLQVQILTLRTRLRGAAPRAAIVRDERE